MLLLLVTVVERRELIGSMQLEMDLGGSELEVTFGGHLELDP